MPDIRRDAGAGVLVALAAIAARLVAVPLVSIGVAGALVFPLAVIGLS
jgi:hypothetical protein